MAWRATLSHLIAIESGRWPYKHRSDSERDDLLASVQRSRMSYGINVRSMRLLAKPKTLALTRNELRTLRCKLRKAVKFYQLAHAEPLPTPTDRRKLLTNVKTAAAQLSRRLYSTQLDLIWETTRSGIALASSNKSHETRTGTSSPVESSYPVPLTGTGRRLIMSHPQIGIVPNRICSRGRRLGRTFSIQHCIGAQRGGHGE